MLATVLVNTIVVIAVPEHIVCDEGVAVAVGVPIILSVTSPMIKILVVKTI